jgi:methionyl-tRNA formyltransferase
MQLDAGLDTGPVLLQREAEISRADTGGSLRAQLATLGASALLEALSGLAAGTLSAHPQPQEGATYAARIDKAEARIDFRRDAIEIERQVRAFNPAPIAHAQFDGERLRVWAARALDDDSGESAAKTVDPGVIVSVQDGSMIVQCGRGRLAVMQVQRPGRRPVSVRELSHSLSLTGRRLD